MGWHNRPRQNIEERVEENIKPVSPESDSHDGMRDYARRCLGTSFPLSVEHDRHNRAFCRTYPSTWEIINARFNAAGSAAYGHAITLMQSLFKSHYDIVLTRFLYLHLRGLSTDEWRSWGVASTLIVMNLVLKIGRIYTIVEMASPGRKFWILLPEIGTLFIVAIWFLFSKLRDRSLDELADNFDMLGEPTSGEVESNTLRWRDREG